MRSVCCAHTDTHRDAVWPCIYARVCSIRAPPHLLSQFPGRTPVLLIGGGVGGEAGGVEEDTEVGVKASAHLSLRFLGSPIPSLHDTTIQSRVGTLCLGLLISLHLLHQEENGNTTCVKSTTRVRAHMQAWSRPDRNIFLLC